MEQNRVAMLLRYLNDGVFEKEHVMAMGLLSAVAGESIFLLGPPGVAKSMIARSMKRVFRGGRSFEYLMSRFSTPDEIFGPVSVVALKDENRYVRMTEGYLPEADVVFLDEIWKAGPSIQNALLTVLNEKVYLNGNREMRLPLKLVIAASNELPAENENLEALWDRFLVRCLVGGISDRELFNRMVASPAAAEPMVDENLLLTADELAAWSEGVDRVEIPKVVFDFIHLFRARVAAYNARAEERTESSLYISDRRWKKIVRLWRASAFLNGTSTVHVADLLLLYDCVWDVPGQCDAVAAMLTDVLVETVEEHFGFPLLQERLNALKGASLSSALPAAPSFKVVKAFFYQIQSMYANRSVLIYASEYDALPPSDAVPFILTTDRRKTGAQILRRYDKARYPDVFPKDLLEVRKSSDGLLVNGRNYALLRSDNEVRTESRTSRPEVAADVIRRVAAELEETVARMEEWQQEETAYVGGQMFLDEGMRDMLRNALRRVRADVSSMQIDGQELLHAAEHR